MSLIPGCSKECRYNLCHAIYEANKELNAQFGKYMKQNLTVPMNLFHAEIQTKVATNQLLDVIQMISQPICLRP